MTPEIELAILNNLASYGLVLAVFFALILFRKPLASALQHMGSMEVAGIRLEFVRNALIEAAEAAKRRAEHPVLEPLDETTLAFFEQHARAIAGKRVLWLDPNPDNNRVERRMLRHMGLLVDICTDDEEAEKRLWDYDLIIQNGRRNGDKMAGQKFAEKQHRLYPQQPVIMYVGKVNPSISSPVRGVTARPDELMRLVVTWLSRQS